MKNIKYIIPLLLLTACQARKPEIDCELLPFVQVFEDTFQVKVTSDVSFEEEYENKTVGRCTYNRWSHVTVKRGYFKNLDYYGQEQLMFHELAHCEFFLGHNNGTITFPDEPGVWPISIMRSVAFDKDELEVYKRHRKHYMEELKNGTYKD